MIAVAIVIRIDKYNPWHKAPSLLCAKTYNTELNDNGRYIMIVVGDLEADGLLNEATRVWCGVFIEIETGKKRSFGPDQVEEMLAYMDTCPVLVFHNGVGYDFPLLKKLYGYEYKGVVVDTLLMSRLQDPDRKTTVHM